MKIVTKLSSSFLLSAISLFSWWGIAQAEMIVETRDGQRYTLPVTRSQVRSIRFSEDEQNTMGQISSVWQGTWNTSEGVMTLTQSGNTVQGTYTQDNGRIQGQLTGNTLNGYWIENGSARRCDRPIDGSYHWGRISYTINSNGSAFNGLWSYCDAQPSSSWNGSKS